MTQLFFSFAQTGLWVLLIAMILTALTPLVRIRYRARALRWIWLALAVRLLLPANLPNLSPVRLEVEVPAALTEIAVKAPQALADVTAGAPEATLPAQAQTKTEEGTSLSPVHIAAGVWLAGAASLLTAELVRYAFWRRRAMRWNRPLPGDVSQEVARAAKAVGLARAPRAFVNEAVSVPMTAGALYPALLLPAWILAEGKREQLRAVLLHELTHCRRCDTLCRFAALLARCVHWYNPGAWIVERQFERAAELACDESVLELPVSHRAYADALMTAVRASAGRPSLTTCFASDKKFLRSRLAAVFSRERKRRGAALAAIVCAAAVCTALVACSPATPQSASGQPASSSPEASGSSSGNLEEIATFNTSLDGVYTTRKVYAYTRVENPKNGAMLDSEAGTYAEIPLPELEGWIGVPLYGGALDGTRKIRLCTVADSGEAIFYASDDGGTTYREKRGEATLPDGSKAQAVEMQNVTDELCLLLVKDPQGCFWLLRCGADENGLPALDGAQALRTPVAKDEGVIRMSFVNEDVGYLVDKGDVSDGRALPRVWRTTDGGAAWSQLDFSDVLADCPFDGYYACCIFTVGNRTEVRCFTTPDATTIEWIALVSSNFGQTWDWYPRVPNEGTDFVIEEDKAAGLEKILLRIYPEDDGGEEYARIREFIETDGQPENLYFRF